MPRTFGILALAGRRLLPLAACEAMERTLGAERVFQDDVDAAQRTGYASRTGTS